MKNTGPKVLKSGCGKSVSGSFPKNEIKFKGTTDITGIRNNLTGRVLESM